MNTIEYSAITKLLKELTNQISLLVYEITDSDEWSDDEGNKTVLFLKDLHERARIVLDTPGLTIEAMRAKATSLASELLNQFTKKYLAIEGRHGFKVVNTQLFLDPIRLLLARCKQ